ncbi:MAG: hypothetical protein GX971_09950 [Firmicutes bacterium]|nr:hypothetical protein [Bacillota bacterium]
MKRINVLLLFVILCLSLVIAPVTLLAQEDDVVAKVNGVAITRAQLLELLEAEYGAYGLQELIQKELIKQKSEELQVSIDEDEWNETYALITAQLGGPQGLYMLLLQNGITEQQFIEQLRWNMLISNLASAEVAVTDEEVATWFEENRTYYDQPKMVEASHILVDTEEEAKEVLARLQGGEALAELAAELSLDPGTAPNGGYLGQITEGLTVPEFEEMAFSLAVGEFGIAESNYGWHIITVHSIQEAKAAIFDEIADLVKQDLRRTRALDAQSYISKLENEANLEILWRP